MKKTKNKLVLFINNEEDFLLSTREIEGQLNDHLRNVSKTYTSKHGDVAALNSTNLHIKPGEIYGIIGLSGAGKKHLGALH